MTTGFPRALASLAAVSAMLAACAPHQAEQTSAAAAPAVSPVERGRYLVTVMDCGGCHTPGALIGRPDMARQLTGAGHGWEVPGTAVVYPPNLTPHPEAGLGGWSEAQIVAAIRTGARPDGRELQVMPWRAYAALTDADAAAVAAYLKSLPPSPNRAPALTSVANATAPYHVMRVPGAPPASP